MYQIWLWFVAQVQLSKFWWFKESISSSILNAQRHIKQRQTDGTQPNLKSFFLSQSLSCLHFSALSHRFISKCLYFAVPAAPKRVNKYYSMFLLRCVPTKIVSWLYYESLTSCAVHEDNGYVFPCSIMHIPEGVFIISHFQLSVHIIPDIFLSRWAGWNYARVISATAVL